MSASALALCACAALTSLQGALCQPTGEENQIHVIETTPLLDGNRPKSNNENSFRRALSSLPGRRLGRLRSGQDLESLRQALQTPDDWTQHFGGPSPAPHGGPPSADTPECFVEIRVTQRVPGRCTRLGSNRVPACQAQDLLSMDYDTCGDDD